MTLRYHLPIPMSDALRSRFLGALRDAAVRQGKGALTEV